MRQHSLSCQQMQRSLQSQPFGDLGPAEQEHLADCPGCMDLLLSETLEAKPQVAVPEGFAARVAANLPACPISRPSRRPQYGRGAAIISFGLLAAGMVSIAFLGPEWLVANLPLSLLIETLTLAEAGAIAYWLARENGAL